MRIAPGDLVGKFRVERIIGRGGMGLVVEATNIQLDQRVALKLLAPGKDGKESIDAVLNEARAAVRLRSDHIARVQDVDVDAVHGPYIVMELLDGQSLADMLADGKRLSVQRGAEYIIDACEGLAEAHVRGIIHQDIKPANLFVAMGNDGRPAVKVLDFGIAKMRQSPAGAAVDMRMSLAGNALGTPFYLAPEQLRSDVNADHRADIWALGCVLFEVLTGTRAFSAARYTELVVQILESPRASVPDGMELPSALLEVIDRCLVKDPNARYASTGELALALLPFARRRAHSVTTRAVTRVREGGLDPNHSMPSSMPPPSETSIDLVSSQSLRAPPAARISLEPSEPVASSPKRRAVVVALALLAALGLFVAYTAGKSREPVAASKAATPPASTERVPAKSPPPRAADLPPTTARDLQPEASVGSPEPAPQVAPAAAQPPFQPGPAVAPPSPSTVAPRNPDSEIRMTR